MKNIDDTKKKKILTKDLVNEKLKIKIQFKAVCFLQSLNVTKMN